MFISSNSPKPHMKANSPLQERSFLSSTMQKAYDLIQKYPGWSCAISGLGGATVAAAYKISQMVSQYEPEIRYLNREIKLLENSNLKARSSLFIGKIGVGFASFLMCATEIGVLYSCYYMHNARREKQRDGKKYA